MKLGEYLQQWQTVKSETDVALELTKLLPGDWISFTHTSNKNRLLWQYPVSQSDYVQQLEDLHNTLSLLSQQSVITSKVIELMELRQITTKVSELSRIIRSRISMVIDVYGDDGDDDFSSDSPSPVPIAPHESTLEPQFATAS